MRYLLSHQNTKAPGVKDGVIYSIGQSYVLSLWSTDVDS